MIGIRAAWNLSVACCLMALQAQALLAEDKVADSPDHDAAVSDGPLNGHERYACQFRGWDVAATSYDRATDTVRFELKEVDYGWRDRLMARDLIWFAIGDMDNKGLASIPVRWSDDDAVPQVAAIRFSDIDAALKKVGRTRDAVSVIYTFTVYPSPLEEKSLPESPITFTKTDKVPAPRHTTPDKNLGLDVQGVTARLVESGGGKHVGRTFYLDGPFDVRMKITCWAFSGDGKYVAIAGGDGHGGGDDSTSVGQIRVWDVSTGGIVAARDEEFGWVHAIAFAGHTLLVDAEGFNVDGR